MEPGHHEIVLDFPDGVSTFIVSEVRFLRESLAEILARFQEFRFSARARRWRRHSPPQKHYGPQSFYWTWPFRAAFARWPRFPL